GTACWAILSPERPVADGRRPAFRVIERLAERGVALHAWRGPRPLPRGVARKLHGPLWPRLVALKRELDPAGILNPGALGL
ncbi:MAG: hypothetical protein QME96_18900, partial [Myxococcota bacterium]|nr:hypothetical protein [Myxococcota bacterium]